MLELRLQGTTVVCLAELETPILENVNEEQFAAIKSMALDAQRVIWVIWVSSGGVAGVKNPYADMAVGFGRTICSEREEQSYRKEGDDGGLQAVKRRRVALDG